LRYPLESYALTRAQIVARAANEIYAGAKPGVQGSGMTVASFELPCWRATKIANLEQGEGH
jgi:hypothetical protein